MREFMASRLRRGLGVGFVAALAVMTALAVYLIVSTPTYTASAVIALLPKSEARASGELVRISVPTYARLATSDAVAAALEDRYGVDRRRVSSATVADVPPGSNTVLVSVRWDDPQTASDLANGVVDELLTFSEGDPLLSALLVAPALPPTGPGFPSTGLAVTVGTLLALGTGGGTAVLAARRSGRRSSPARQASDGYPAAAGLPSGAAGLPDHGVAESAERRSAVQPDLRH